MNEQIFAAAILIMAGKVVFFALLRVQPIRLPVQPGKPAMVNDDEPSSYNRRGKGRLDPRKLGSKSPGQSRASNISRPQHKANAAASLHTHAIWIVGHVIAEPLRRWRRQNQQ